MAYFTNYDIIICILSLITYIADVVTGEALFKFTINYTLRYRRTIVWEWVGYDK